MQLSGTAIFRQFGEIECISEFFGHPVAKKEGKRIPFLKNKAGELLKIKDEPKKQTENKAETKLAMLLKIKGTPKNKPETNRKTNLKRTQARRPCLTAAD